jgi:hypothetical protein
LPQVTHIWNPYQLPSKDMANVKVFKK